MSTGLHGSILYTIYTFWKTKSPKTQPLGLSKNKLERCRDTIINQFKVEVRCGSLLSWEDILPPEYSGR